MLKNIGEVAYTSNRKAQVACFLIAHHIFSFALSHQTQSPTEECFYSHDCIGSCGRSCISECCREEACMDEPNHEKWNFPVKFGEKCYNRCFDDCAADWEDKNSCPMRCMASCETQTFAKGYNFDHQRQSWRYVLEPHNEKTRSTSEGSRFYNKCVYACLTTNGCSSCMDECDQECILSCDAKGEDPFIMQSIQNGRDCYTDCYNPCMTRTACEIHHPEVGYEFDTVTGEVVEVEVPELTPLEICQNDCAYDCEDECGSYDGAGQFHEKEIGCFEKCFDDCKISLSCTDEMLDLEAESLGDFNYSDQAASADLHLDEWGGYGGLE